MNLQVEYLDRLITVKAKPTSKLLFVLEQACQELKLNPSSYGLKHKKKLLDLSASVQGITGRLSLAPVSVTTCKVALMYDDRRVVVEASSDLDLLRLVSMYGELDQMPILNFMNQQYTGLATLASTTLKDIGLTRDGAIRFSLRAFADDERLEFEAIKNKWVASELGNAMPQPILPNEQVLANILHETELESKHETELEDKQSPKKTPTLESNEPQNVSQTKTD
jgi:hypothetical protein